MNTVKASILVLVFLVAGGARAMADDSATDQQQKIQQDQAKVAHYKTVSSQDKTKAHKMRKKATQQSQAGKLDAATEADKAASKEDKFAAKESDKAKEAAKDIQNDAATNPHNQ